jgi:hypothetical protein
MKRTAAPALLFIGLVFFSCCQNNQPVDPAYQTKAADANILHAGIRRITEIIRHDVFSPPVASRIYAYSTVAAYEALIPGHTDYQSLAGQLNGLTPTPQPEEGKTYCYPVASARALMHVGRALIFSESDMDSLSADMKADFERSGVPKDVFDRSVVYGDKVAKHILAWSKTDNYAQIRSAPKVSVDVKTRLPGKKHPLISKMP